MEDDPGDAQNLLWRFLMTEVNRFNDTVINKLKVRIQEVESKTSLRTLSEKADVPLSTLSSILGKKRVVGLYTMFKLASALGVPLSEFLPSPEEHLSNVSTKNSVGAVMNSVITQANNILE